MLPVLPVLLSVLALSLGGPVEEARARELQAAITAGDFRRVNEICRTFHRHHNPQRLLALLIDSINTPNEAGQAAVIDRLADFRHEAKAVIPPLVGIAARKPKNIIDRPRTKAIIMLGYFGPAAAEAVPALKGALDDPYAFTKYMACVSLWKIEGKPETIVPVIKAGLQSESTYEQLEALKAQRFLGSGLKEHIGPLVIALRESEWPMIRTEVYSLLPVFAPDPATAAKLLADCLIRVKKRQADHAKRVEGGRISIEQGALIHNSHRTEWLTINRTLISLRSVAVPELVRLLHEPSTKWVALEILAGLGRDARSAAPEIEKLTGDPVFGARATKTLKEITAE